MAFFVVPAGSHGEGKRFASKVQYIRWLQRQQREMLHPVMGKRVVYAPRETRDNPKPLAAVRVPYAPPTLESRSFGKMPSKYR